MHDSRVFKTVVSTPNENFPHPTGDKYYLVDAGYPNRKGFLAPYKGDRMHMQQFPRGGGPRNPRERFNQVHSSLRSVIERTFGIWKSRWAILRDMPPYDFSVQVDIVGCSMGLHNFICIHEGRERRRLDASNNSTETASSSQQAPDGEHNIYPDDDEGQDDDDADFGGDAEMDAIRDQICGSVNRNWPIY